jgi:hypothetical protein
MISPILVSALLTLYAPKLPKSVGAGIATVESLGDAWAINDNTVRYSYHPRSYAEAVTLAHDLTGRGHVLDLGLMQIDTVHLGKPGITIERMLRPGPNLEASQRIFLGDILAAGNDVRAALSMYNSGSRTASLVYADKVLAASSSPYGSAIMGNHPLILHEPHREPVIVVQRGSAIGATDDAFKGTAW